MDIVCLDLEGVLVPEIWIALAERTGIDELRLTTRDNPDYDDLMRHRLKLVEEHHLGLPDLQAAVATLTPLDGAVEFLVWLRARAQMVVLSDTYYQLAGPLMRQLGDPLLLCHRLEADAHGHITGYKLRQDDPKRHAVEAFQSLNYRVIAAGDSYNDTSMLKAADAGILFRPPDNVIAEFPDFPVTRDYDQLRDAIEAALDYA